MSKLLWNFPVLFSVKLWNIKLMDHPVFMFKKIAHLNQRHFFSGSKQFIIWCKVNKGGTCTTKGFKEIWLQTLKMLKQTQYLCILYHVHVLNLFPIVYFIEKFPQHFYKFAFPRSRQLKLWTLHFLSWNYFR